MPESQRVKETRQRTMGRVRAARSAVAALSNRVGSIWADVRLSQQGREEEAARIVGEARASILETLAAARRDVDAGLHHFDHVLGRLTEVAPEVLAARATVLSPILNSALERPEVLINAYRRRFHELADRRLLEESAEAVIDALGGSDGGQFAQRWRFQQEELAVGRPAEELQAVSDRAALSELASYLDSAERVVGLELANLDPESEVSDTAMIGVQVDRKSVV